MRLKNRKESKTLENLSYCVQNLYIYWTNFAGNIKHKRNTVTILIFKSQ